MVMNWLCACGLVALTAGLIPDHATAQSTVATVFDTVSDEHRAALVGAAITLTSLDTGGRREDGSGGRARQRHRDGRAEPRTTS
jgi:hypothetical protein